jgi:hypothetical protein
MDVVVVAVVVVPITAATAPSIRTTNVIVGSFVHIAAVNVRANDPRQAKVTDFQSAVFVKQNVGRFDISMDYHGRMHVFESTEELVEEGFDVVDCEVLWAIYEFVKICVNKFKHHIELIAVHRPVTS